MADLKLLAISGSLRAKSRNTALLREAVALSRQRRQLAALDATRLDDLGLTAQDARREAARPFWDAPQHWKA